MNDYLFESTHPNGTYACLIPSVKSKEDLYAYCVNLGISKLEDPDEYHCTLIYSKSECPDISGEDFGNPCRAIPVGFKVLGKEKKVLVLEVYCPNAVRLHNLFMEKYGATHDYPEYIPHITVAGEFDGEIPADIPEFEIEFSGQKIEELS
jgi:hypothetical protein